ncbi:hypothetical protein TeGR_g14393, partial [Tetraparma gracilis]
MHFSTLLLLLCPSTLGLAPPSLPDAQRVVLTGLGVISGAGSTLPSFTTSVFEGRSSISSVSRFDTSTYPLPCTVASEVNEFDPKPFFDNPKSVRSNDRYTHFAVAASKLALEDAGLPTASETPSSLGVMIGSAFGGAETFERETLKVPPPPSPP